MSTRPTTPERPRTLQDYFTIAWNHAVVQKQPPAFVKDAAAPTGVRCFYRTASGARCLIGAAIADADYRPDIEGLGVSQVLHRLGYPLPASDYLLNELQACHDDAVHEPFYPEAVERRLRMFAIEHGLEIPA